MTPVCVRLSCLEIGRWKPNIIWHKRHYKNIWENMDYKGFQCWYITFIMDFKHCLAFQTLGSCPFSSYESGNEHTFQNNMFHSNTRWWIKSTNPAIPTWNIPWQPNFHYSSISVNYVQCTMHYNSISEPLSVSVICWSKTNTQRTFWSQEWDFLICFQLWLKFYLKLHMYYYIQVYYKETRHKDFVILNKLYLFHRKVLPNKLSRFLVLSLFHLSNSMYISHTHF